MTIQEKRDMVLEALRAASNLPNKENIVPLIIESIRDGYVEVDCISESDQRNVSYRQSKITPEELFLIDEMDYYLSELKK